MSEPSVEAEKPAAPTLAEGGQLADHSDGRDVVLKLRGVRTQFGDNIIHDNLDFDVFRGEFRARGRFGLGNHPTWHHHPDLTRRPRAPSRS
jgi:hypothetical protein